MPSALKTYVAKAKRKQSEAPASIAFHAEGGETHVVGIGHLRVILCHEKGYWFAQGLEIDYAASGKTQKAAKLNFENGLEATIDQHLKIYDSIEKILVPAPAKIWQELVPKGKSMRYSQVTFHDRPGDALRAIPYTGIDWLEPTDQVAA